jgi:hypothetical protein
MGLEANDSNAVAENEAVETDNSEVVDNHEPLGETEEESQDENSGKTVDDQEPANDSSETAKQQGKFNSLDDANKSYSELEKKLGQQSNELGELRKAAEEAQKLREQIANMQLAEAQTKGFDNVQSYQNHKEVAKFIANEYEQHIKECEFPDEMRNLLNEYKANPTDELLETIESQFSVETIKNVAGKNAVFQGQLQEKENEALHEQVKQSAKQYLDENVNKYADEFKNPAFAALYGEAFRAYGCDLDTDKFVELMKQYATAVLKADGIERSITNENSSATDEIAGLTSGGNATKATNGKSLLQLSEKDLDKRLSELI